MSNFKRISLLIILVMIGNLAFGANADALPSGFVIINRAVVKLRDLFPNAGPLGNQSIGPAPLPGQQIVVPAAQRAVIAARFHFVPKTPPHDAVVIRRSGQAVSNAALRSALAPALAAAGAPRRPVIMLINTQSPMIPPGTNPVITTADLHFNATTHNFSALLVVTAPGMGSEPVTVDGLALPSVSVVIASHTLQPGEILTVADIRQARVPQSNLPARPVRRVATAIGQQVQREINMNEPLPRHALASPILVRKGALVELVVHLPGMTISARGVALAAGAFGDVIAVLNPNSQAVLQAIVRGSDRAEVVPGTVTTPHRANPYFHPAGY